MKCIVVCLIVAGIFGGFGPRPTPRMPQMQTDQGKANARACLARYNTCERRCGLRRSTACVNHCGDTLRACYAAAE